MQPMEFFQKHKIRVMNTASMYTACLSNGVKIYVNKSTKEWSIGEDGTQNEWNEEKILELIQPSGEELFINTAPKDMRPEAYHGIFGEIVNSILPYTEADPKALLMNTITMLGNMIGKRVCYKINEAEIHYPVVFYVQVGDTGVGRKGTAWNNIKYLGKQIDEMFSEHIVSGLSTGEGLISHINTNKAYWQEAQEGVNPNDYRFLVVESEFSRVLTVAKRENNTISETIIRTWDNTELRITTRKEPLKCEKYALSMIGHITKQELNVKMSEVDTVNGFANRFLWIWTRKSKDLPIAPKGDGMIYQHYSARINDILNKLPKFDKDSKEYELDEGALELWSEEMYSRLGEIDSSVAGIVNRGQPYVLRLALIFAVMDGADCIKVEHLRAAEAIWDYNVQSVKYIFNPAESESNHQKVLDVLKVGDLSSSEISDKAFKRNLKGYAELLQNMENQGLIKSYTVGEGRRKKQMWALLRNIA